MKTTQNQWDKYSELYNSGIGKEGDSLHKNLIDPMIFDFLGDYENKTILDAGFGNGYLLQKLSKQKCQLIGIDSSEDLTNIAKNNLQNANIILIKDDLTKRIPLEDQSVDIVIANMVLQYLPELNIFAKKTKRILKHNGILIIVLDHPSHSLFFRAQELAGKRNDKFITNGNYLKEEKRCKKSLWDKAILEYYHRPIKSYINSFTQFFKLDKIEEKSEDNEIPRILGLKWIKN